MCRRLHIRSRSTLCSLALALLALAMLGTGAFAQPVAMAGVGTLSSRPRVVAMSPVLSQHCDDMSPDRSAPTEPMNGQGCCHGGGCYCSSSCSGIIGAPPSIATRQSVQGPVIRPIYSQPGLTRSAPPLRPPIA